MLPTLHPYTLSAFSFAQHRAQLHQPHCRDLLIAFAAPCGGLRAAAAHSFPSFAPCTLLPCLFMPGIGVLTHTGSREAFGRKNWGLATAAGGWPGSPCTVGIRVKEGKGCAKTKGEALGGAEPIKEKLWEAGLSSAAAVGGSASTVGCKFVSNAGDARWGACDVVGKQCQCKPVRNTRID